MWQVYVRSGRQSVRRGVKKRLFPDQAGLKVLAAHPETAERRQVLVFLLFLRFPLVLCLV